MKLVIIAALIAVCGAAKLDRTYLPPPSAKTAGGNSDSLQTPLTRSSSEQGQSTDLPTGSFTNNFQGVVVDAATAGVRTSPNADQSGLGGPRDGYGSTNSKVGDAAFRGSLAGFRNTPTFGSALNGQGAEINAGQNFGTFESKSERPQAEKDRNSNIISYANDVSSDNYSYGFQSDNGIAVEENGVAGNGIQAQGGYSYKGDDGQVYKVTYVADENGYRPQGAHLPTPPPIPKEILESLERNAKEEAAGLVDDGSYDAQKYNAEGDYTHHNGGNIQYNGVQLSQFAERPESDTTASSTSINQNNQVFGKPSQSNTISSNQFNGNKLGSNIPNTQNGITKSQDKQPSQFLGANQHMSTSFHSSSQFGLNTDRQLTSQTGKTQSANESQIAQFGGPRNKQVPATQSGTQFMLFGSEGNEQELLVAQSNHQSSQNGYQQEISSQFAGQPSQVGSAFHTAKDYTKSPFASNQGSSFGNQVYKPQDSPSQTQFDLGKPQYSNLHSGYYQTQYNTQGFNRPSFGNTNVSKPTAAGQGQTNITSTIGYDGAHSNTQSQFGAEYLPPFSPNDKQTDKNPQKNQVNDLQESNTFISLQGQNQGFNTTASTSSEQLSELHPAAPINTFQNQYFRPSQFNYNTNSKFTSFGQMKLDGLENDGSNPTNIPDTELTTPLEPIQKPISLQDTRFHSQTPSSFSNFSVQPSNNVAQYHNSFSNNMAVQQSPLVSSNSQPQSTAQKKSYSGNKQDNNAFSTQKPSFSQGPDDSYIYNQPSKLFDTPAARPQGSRFPSSPSYQSNGVVSSIQPGSPLSFNKYSSSSQLAPAVPTISFGNAQPQGTFTSNYYNGITQASISPFPTASPTISAQYHNTQSKFESLPHTNEPLAQAQPYRPTAPEQQTAFTSFSSKPYSTFGKNASSLLIQNQIQSGYTPSSNNGQSSVVQSLQSKPIPNLGQSSSPQFTQIQNSEIPHDEQSTSTHQNQGTIYEYNKPPEVLPTPEPIDSSSSQSIQMDSSLKPQENIDLNTQPQFASEHVQSGQQVLLSQPQASLMNSNNKPQFASSFKPFDSSASAQTQISHINHPTFAQNSFQQTSQESQSNAQQTKPIESSISTPISQNSQGGLESRPQVNQPSRTASEPSLEGLQYHQHSQTSSFPLTSQKQELHSGVMSFNPIGSGQSFNTQFVQDKQAGPSSQTLQQNYGSQLSQQPSKAFDDTSSHSSGFDTTQHNLQTSQVISQPHNPFGIIGTTQEAKPTNAFGTAEISHSFEGYPSSKPTFGAHFTQTQDTYGATQINSQGTFGTQSDMPSKVTNIPLSDGSSEYQKPQFGQKSQAYQGNTPPGSVIGQQNITDTQFGSMALMPQFGIQSRPNHSFSPFKPFSTASNHAQFGQNSAQASNSIVSQQEPQSSEEYKPFKGSIQGSRFQSQNKPQFDQTAQPMQEANTQSQFGTQLLRDSETQGSRVKSQTFPNRLMGGQQGNPCCQGSKDSSIIPLNIGKPSQAFAQTQGQFTGFQGGQSLNAQSVAGKGEEFGGPRLPPRFDAQTGYHY